MQTVSKYFSGQGKLLIAPVAGGVIQYPKLRWLGNVPELSLEMGIETVKHKESYSGNRAVDRTIVKETNVAFKAKIEEFTMENLKLAFRAHAAQVAQGSAQDIASISDLKAGDTWLLPHTGVSQLVITDSTGSPKTLEAGTHYTLDATFGRVSLLNVDGMKMPLKAAYQYAGATVLSALQEAYEGWYLRFEGLNTAEANEPVLVELLRTDISPAKVFGLIQDELAGFDLEGNVLLHNGEFARISLLNKPAA